MNQPHKLLTIAMPVMLLLSLVAWDIFFKSGDKWAGFIAASATIVVLMFWKAKKLKI